MCKHPGVYFDAFTYTKTGRFDTESHADSCLLIRPCTYKNPETEVEGKAQAFPGDEPGFTWFCRNAKRAARVVKA